MTSVADADWCVRFTFGTHFDERVRHYEHVVNIHVWNATECFTGLLWTEENKLTEQARENYFWGGRASLIDKETRDPKRPLAKIKRLLTRLLDHFGESGIGRLY